MASKTTLGDLIGELRDDLQSIESAADDARSILGTLEDSADGQRPMPDPATSLTQGQDTLPDHERRLDAAEEAVRVDQGRRGVRTMREALEIAARAYVGWRP
ncbi:hypothetical protein LCGC14_2900180 [marine sediment metagenome]|uniref:Uncharacterized protein n=1 Tax=marine sediment metagenome TaxID=412755 RepID=A0A0F8XV06_9ZZZZ